MSLSTPAYFPHRAVTRATFAPIAHALLILVLLCSACTQETLSAQASSEASPAEADESKQLFCNNCDDNDPLKRKDAWLLGGLPTHEQAAIMILVLAQRYRKVFVNDKENLIFGAQLPSLFQLVAEQTNWDISIKDLNPKIRQVFGKSAGDLTPNKRNVHIYVVAPDPNWLITLPGHLKKLIGNGTTAVVMTELAGSIDNFVSDLTTRGLRVTSRSCDYRVISERLGKRGSSKIQSSYIRINPPGTFGDGSKIPIITTHLDWVSNACAVYVTK